MQSVRRRLVLAPLALFALAACSSSPSSSATTGATTTTANAANGSTQTTVAVTGLLPSTTLGPTTTFMHDCSPMPTATDIHKIVGVAIADAAVTGAGTCQYNGLNDQTKYIVLSLLTNKQDIATFADMQQSLGKGTPIQAKGLSGALVGIDHSLYMTVNGSVYVVRTRITTGTPAQQVALSVKILQRWLLL
ncbi:MAG: hypothetical protein WCI22_06850 [Actinomycetota bacterium]